MTSRLPEFPRPDRQTLLAALGVVCLLIIPTGAVVYNELDLLGPENEIALEPYDGPNGEYAKINAEQQLTVNVTEVGVNPDAETDIKRVFVIANVGDDEKRVWITHTNEQAVTFYDDSTGNPITEADNLTLAPDERVVVSVRVDTTDPTVNAGNTLVTSLYIHTQTFDVPRPAVEAPEAVGFGNVTAGTSTTAEIQLHNPGNATLELSNFSIEGPNASAFERVGTGDLPSIQPGASASLSLRFSPETPGGKSATVEIVTNAPDAPTISIDLTGTGEFRDLTIVNGATVDFGSVETGSTAREIVTVRNDGSSPIAVGSITTTGVRASDFDVENAGLPVQLDPGETHDVSVAFSPTTTGPASATLVVTGGEEATEVVQAELLGRGDVAAITVQPSLVDFGGIGKDKRANATVTISSTGTIPVSLDDFGFGGQNADQFSIETAGAPERLQPGETATLAVWFEPTRAGNLSAILTIDTNATGSPTTTIPVEGAGLAADIGIGDDNLDFGNVTVGASKTLNVTVWNEEDSPTDLHVHSTFIVGANPEAFNITGGHAPFTLAPGETKDVEVTYNPDTPGIKTAQLRILSDAGNSPQIDVWMSNTGWRIRVQQVAPKSSGVDGDEEEWSMDPEIVNDDSVRVEMDADDIPEGMVLTVNVSQPNTRVASAGTDEITLTVEREGSFDMNFIHSATPPTTESPSYSPPSGRKVVQHITLWHSISNADFSDPSLTYRVRKSSLPDDATPEDVVFRRYADGQWNSHEAVLVKVSADHYVYRVELPGLSEFVITAPNASQPDDGETEPGDEGDPGTGPSTSPDEPTGPTVEKGDTTITFEGSDEEGDLQEVVSIEDLPVPTPGEGRDGPEAAITAGDLGAGINAESIDIDEPGVSVTVSTDDQYLEQIQARGADAMAIVDEPIPLTASHSLFGSKESIDDHWRMIRRMEITVPPEYEDRPATIRIRVPIEQFQTTDPENATIARQHDGWQLLATDVVDRTADEVVLEADTPGFSIFAIFADNEVAYEWEVETYDESLSGVTIEPTFDDPGIYNVSLTVTDSFGLTDTTRYRILANDVPAVEIERASSVTLNESTTLLAVVDDDFGDVAITWTFPDGRVATGRTVDYTFESGVQTVRVVAVDEFGAQAAVERQFDVGNYSPLSVDSIVRTLSLDGRIVLLVLLLVALYLIVRRWGSGLLLLPLDHSPAITVLEKPVFELDNRRVVIPTLQVVDRGGDLDTFGVSLLSRDERVLATGSGSIDGGQEFEATSVVLRATTDEQFDRDQGYAIRVVVTDEAGNETLEQKPAQSDPFVYPIGEP